METATDSTLLFLKSDGEMYRISLPFLSLQPVQAAGGRPGHQLDGRRRAPQYARHHPAGGGRERSLPHRGHEADAELVRKDPPVCFHHERDVYAVYATDETAPALVDESDVVLLGILTEVSSPYEKDGGLYEILPSTPRSSIKTPRG